MSLDKALFHIRKVQEELMEVGGDYSYKAFDMVEDLEAEIVTNIINRDQAISETLAKKDRQQGVG